ncbi:hypothetical protein [Spirosoma sp. KCTC 42546]|nr:hypothetical protein [Spirosoma sp. KCTC 42546]
MTAIPNYKTGDNENTEATLNSLDQCGNLPLAILNGFMKFIRETSTAS